jgi:hypothetical protein
MKQYGKTLQSDQSHIKMDSIWAKSSNKKYLFSAYDVPGMVPAAGDTRDESKQVPALIHVGSSKGVKQTVPALRSLQFRQGSGI